MWVLPVPELPSAITFSRRSAYSHRANSMTSILLRDGSLEVEAIEAFDGGEPGLPDPTLYHAALTVDQLQFGQANQIAHTIGALGGALAGQLVVFAQEPRQPQGLQAMAQQHSRRIGHDAPPMASQSGRMSFPASCNKLM